jgi:hypothetical protein
MLFELEVRRCASARCGGRLAFPRLTITIHPPRPSHPAPLRRAQAGRCSVSRLAGSFLACICSGAAVDLAHLKLKVRFRRRPTGCHCSALRSCSPSPARAALTARGPPNRPRHPAPRAARGTPALRRTVPWRDRAGARNAVKQKLILRE